MEKNIIGTLLFLFVGWISYLSPVRCLYVGGFTLLMDEAIILVQPETVIRWHRRGFRAYWRWKSRHVGGRPRIDSEIRALIRRMSLENPL